MQMDTFTTRFFSDFDYSFFFKSSSAHTIVAAMAMTSNPTAHTQYID